MCQEANKTRYLQKDEEEVEEDREGFKQAKPFSDQQFSQGLFLSKKKKVSIKAAAATAAAETTGIREKISE